MKRSKLLMVVALFSVVLLSGCILDSSDSEITCDNFDHFLANCADSNCVPTWDCELNYDSLPYGDQIALDDCSDCMAANASGGFCGDCSASGVPSCIQFMEDLLHVDCW
jgi:hypothetical protein